MITGEEFAKRIKRVSQMRHLVLTLRRAAREAHRRGEIPFEPMCDVRSDPEYWMKLKSDPGAGETAG